MATRTVEIKVDMDAGKVTAEVTKMAEATNRFTRDARLGTERTAAAFTQLQANVIAFNQALDLTQRLVTGVNRVFDRLVSAAAGQEDAVNRLNSTLQITGRTVPVERFTKFATEIQSVTRYEDEAVLSTVTLLGQLTDLDEQGLQAAARGAIGLATVLDKDLPTAAQAVARALTGNVQGLQRYGITINDNLTLQEKQKQVLERLEPLFKRAEADTKTYSGATAQLRNAVSDLAEEIGTPLVSALAAVSRSITPQVQAAIEWASTNRELVASITALVAVIAGSAGLTVALGVLAATIGSFIASPTGLVIFLGLIGAGALAFAAFRDRINDFTESLSKAGAEQGLQRKIEELQRLEKLRDQIAAKPRFSADSPLNEEQRRTEARISQLKQEIEDRKKLIEQFDAASKPLPGGQLPKIIDKSAEEARKKAIDDAKRFAESVDKQNEALALQILQLTDSQEAIDEWKVKLLEGEAATLKLTAAQRGKIEKQRELLGLLRQLKEQEDQAAASAKFLAESEAAEVAAKAEARQEIEREFQLKQQLLDLDIDRLRAAGLTQQADAAQLEGLIKLNEERKRAIELAAQEGRIFRQPGELSALDKQIEIHKTRLDQIHKITIDVGKAIADTLVDIGHGIATGTLKGFDILKAAGASAINLVADIFRQTLQQKLSFEVSLLANMRGLPGQMNQALASGAASIPGGSGGGGFLSSIFEFLGVGGGAAGPFSGFDIADAGGFLGTAPGGFLSQIGGSIASLFGTSGAGSGLLGGVGQFFKDIFGGNSILGSFGGPVLGGLGGLLFSALSGGFGKGQIGSTIGSTIGGIGGGFFGPIGAVVGSMLGNLLGGLFNSTPNPTVRVRANVEGFVYDAIENAFKFGDISTRASGTDISGSVVKQTKTEVQTILERQSKVWTDILNLFPAVVHDAMLPAIENANKLLEQQFSRLKFSEGGSRTIAEELAHLAERGAPGKFFLASRGIIGAGLRESFNRAGLGGLDALIGEAFAELPADLGKINLNKFKAGGLTVPKKQEDVAAFVDALRGFVGTAGGLAGVSPRGLSPFITDADRQLLESQFAGVLGITDGNQFAQAVADMQERIQPVLDFLNSSLQQTADVFGRGMIAALEAANASDAKAAFMQSLGVGIKDTIFQGITESFLASAQFNDLLAPIQKTIREFVEEATATGETPDIEEFRRAILPGIDQIQERAELLAPLIEELNKLGLDIRDLLGLLGDNGARPSVTIPINIENFTGTDADVNALARRLQEIFDSNIRSATVPR